MQLRQLQHLVALADQGSFGRAAQAVHLSQPALSRSIDNLEEGLQARLIDRAYGTVRFTQAGELVLARARELLADAQQIARDVLELEGLAIGSLAVGLGPFAAGTLGRLALSLMTQRHPQLQMRMEVADPASLCERLHRRQLDLFIADTRDLEKQPGLKLARLPNVPVSFFVRPRHPLLKLKQATLASEEALLEVRLKAVQLELEVKRAEKAALTQAGADRVAELARGRSHLDELRGVDEK